MVFFQEAQKMKCFKKTSAINSGLLALVVKDFCISLSNQEISLKSKSDPADPKTSPTPVPTPSIWISAKEGNDKKSGLGNVISFANSIGCKCQSEKTDREVSWRWTRI